MLISSLTESRSTARALLLWCRATSDDTRVPSSSAQSHQAANESQLSKANAKRPDAAQSSLLRGGLVIDPTERP